MCPGGGPFLISPFSGTRQDVRNKVAGRKRDMDAKAKSMIGAADDDGQDSQGGGCTLLGTQPPPPAPSLVNFGNRASGQGGSRSVVGGSPPRSLVDSVGGTPQMKGKTAIADRYILNLPLTAMLQGQNLGRTRVPAEALCEKWEDDKKSDEEAKNAASILRDHLAACDAATKLKSQIHGMDKSELTKSVKILMDRRTDWPTCMKVELVKRAIKEKRDARDFEGVLIAASPWQYSDSSVDAEWDPLNPSMAAVEGSVSEKADNFANMLVDETLVPLCREAAEKKTEVMSVCKIALERFDAIDDEIDEGYGDVLDTLGHVFKALAALLIPHPGALNSSSTNVDVLFSHAFLEPMSRAQPWARTLASVLKALPYWKDKLADYKNTLQKTTTEWPKILDLSTKIAQKEAVPLPTLDWALQNYGAWRGSLRKGILENLEVAFENHFVLLAFKITDAKKNGDNSEFKGCLHPHLDILKKCTIQWPHLQSIADARRTLEEWIAIDSANETYTALEQGLLVINDTADGSWIASQDIFPPPPPPLPPSSPSHPPPLSASTSFPCQSYRVPPPCLLPLPSPRVPLHSCSCLHPPLVIYLSCLIVLLVLLVPPSIRTPLIHTLLDYASLYFLPPLFHSYHSYLLPRRYASSLSSPCRLPPWAYSWLSCSSSSSCPYSGFLLLLLLFLPPSRSSFPLLLPLHAHPPFCAMSSMSFSPLHSRPPPTSFRFRVPPPPPPPIFRTWSRLCSTSWQRSRATTRRATCWPAWLPRWCRR